MVPSQSPQTGAKRIETDRRTRGVPAWHSRFAFVPGIDSHLLVPAASTFLRADMGNHGRKKPAKKAADAKHAESIFVCAPCKKECSGETSLLQHCMGIEHLRRVGHRGFAGCTPNKSGVVPPLSDEFFSRIAAAQAMDSSPAGEDAAAAVDGIVQSPAHTDKFFQSQYKCAACGTTVSGHISFVEHCRGKAHIKAAGFSGFAGLLPNEGGIIPPVPQQLLATAGDSSAQAPAAEHALPEASATTSPTVDPAMSAAAPAAPPAAAPEKKAVSVKMDHASLAALSQASLACCMLPSLAITSRHSH